MIHSTNLIGIDPGFSGGIAVVSPEFDLIAVHPIPIIKTKASADGLAEAALIALFGAGLESQKETA